MASLWQLIGEHIPNDHYRQVHSRYYLEEELRAPDPPTTMVDLGCGDGSSAKFARKYQPGVRWIGVDIAQSDYAKAITDEQVLFYDGINLPFADDTVPLIYSNQVFEHVRHPEPLLKDIARVLKPGGAFVGSTSQLEPYHAYSLWNYTIYGFKVLIEEAGLVLEQIRPGIDSIALIRRQWLGALPEHNAWFNASPLNAEIDEWGEETKRRPALINARKLQFCGQFSFRVTKPGGPPRVRPPRPELATQRKPAEAAAPAKKAAKPAAKKSPRARLRRRIRRLIGWKRS